MKKTFFVYALSIVFLLCAGAHAMEKHEAGHGGHDPGPAAEKIFKHEAEVEGVKAEFQVMSLESMNMTDPNGADHHVMASFSDAKTGERIKDVIGRIKIIRPGGEEETTDLKDYGGTLAANFKAEAPGKYGIICLFKIAEAKRVVKFWWERP